MNDIPNLIPTIIVVSWIVLGSVWVGYNRRTRKLERKGTSILVSYYTEAIELFPLKSGLIGDMHYSAMATIPLEEFGLQAQSALLYRVELPFHSQVHLHGIPKKAGAVQLKPAGGKSVMERVDLEGDYGSYFSLYAEKGMQSQSRYVLDPKAMVFTVDFCQSHNWEIVGSELYFVQASAGALNDPTSMQDDIVQFVKEIEPAIARPLTAKEIQLRTPYQQERRTDLQCPVCGDVLKNEQSFLQCSRGDGFLLQGSALAQISSGSLRLPVNAGEQKAKRTVSLTCPVCRKPMQETAYNGGKTKIDSCPHCPYRWLDAGEMSRVH